MSAPVDPSDVTPPTGGAPGSPAPWQDDAGSRALGEALRSSMIIVKLVMAVLVAIFIFSGFRIIGPQEKAIVLRFGKPVGVGEKALLDPGFHFAFPPPIDEVVRIPISQIQVARSSTAWYATTPELEAARTEPPPGPTLSPLRDGYTLTADANIVHLRATLRYRIADPVQFAFGFRDVPALLTNALNNALLYTSARFTVDQALTAEVTAFREQVRRRIEQLVTAQALGISVDQVDVETIPPRQLRDKFNAVQRSAVNRDKALYDAQSYANQVLSRARGEGAARINAGQSDSNRLVEMVAAEANKFSELLPKYRENPALFVRLRQAEAVERVLTNAQEKIFITPQSGHGAAPELRLQLGREPVRSKPAAPPAAGEDHH